MRQMITILFLEVFSARNLHFVNAFVVSNRMKHLVTRSHQGIQRHMASASIPSNGDDDEIRNGSKEIHIIQWKTAEGIIEFDAFDGETLRTAALRRGIVSPHNGRSKLINCRGLGTCGTCAVEVISGGKVEPREQNNTERIRLSLPPHGSDSQSPLLRLACQIQVHGDLEVTKRSGFWGQYGSLSPSSEYETYFGDLEFILDNKSPDE
jgi:ferredoxin